MGKSTGYRLPNEISDFADRYQDLLNAAIGNRMRHVGVPGEMVGIKFYGVDEGAFVRYFPPQLGGSIRMGTEGKPGINVDPAVFDANAPKVGGLSSWRCGTLKDRIDAVIAHEYTEATAPDGVDAHLYAVQNAENVTLKIGERARQILRDYRQAEGY